MEAKTKWIIGVISAIGLVGGGFAVRYYLKKKKEELPSGDKTTDSRKQDTPTTQMSGDAMLKAKAASEIQDYANTLLNGLKTRLASAKYSSDGINQEKQSLLKEIDKLNTKASQLGYKLETTKPPLVEAYIIIKK